MIQPQSGKDLLEVLGSEKIIKSYTALKIKFVFPSNVSYPNLPVRLDFSSIIFPLSGETFCTGSEFLLAMRLNCEISILGGVHIPFQNSQTDKDKDKERKSGGSVLREIPVVDPNLTELIDEYQSA